MRYADGIAEMQVCTAAQASGREGKHEQQLSLHAAIGRWKERKRAKKEIHVSKLSARLIFRPGMMCQLILGA